MKYLLIFILLAVGSFSFSQGLSPERVAKIKNSTVQVYVEDWSSIGAGFFFNQDGDLATCWHIIDTAFKAHKKIFIRFNDGDTIEVSIPSLNDKERVIAFAHDYCILRPIKPLTKGHSFLKIGNFNNCSEGEEIYTCGYPLGRPQQFISKGMISTKFVFDNIINVNNLPKLYPVNEALLDLTLNRGNSGGAIIRMGKTFNEDEVIGIADFIVNPLGERTEALKNNFKQSIGNMQMEVRTNEKGEITSGFDPSAINFTFAEAIGSLSIGVSGSISVNYLHAAVLALRK